VATSELPVYESSIPRRRVQDGLTLREDIVYCDAKGKEKPKLRKHADQILGDLGEVLRRVVGSDETIFYFANAQAMPGALEQFFSGWHTYGLPRAVLVLTDRRIVSLRARKRMRGWSWDRGVASVGWGDVAQVSLGGLITRYITIKLRNGEKISYWKFEAGEAKTIKTLSDLLGQHSAAHSTPTGAMVHLCPDCLSTLPPGGYQCNQCGLPFKTERELLWRGILIPGGASFYAGRTGFGVIRLIFECLLSVSIALLIWKAARAPSGSQDAAAALTAAGFEALALFLDKLIAILNSRRQIRDMLPVR